MFAFNLVQQHAAAGKEFLDARGPLFAIAPGHQFRAKCNRHPWAGPDACWIVFRSALFFPHLVLLPHEGTRSADRSSSQSQTAEQAFGTLFHRLISGWAKLIRKADPAAL